MVEVIKSLDELELWENISRSRHVLKKFSAEGKLVGFMIPGKKKFHITTRERHINMEMAANPRQDPFSNGQFSPVELLETTDDAEQIASNPNLIGETEMVELVKGRADSLKKRLAQIENPIVLGRLYEVAEEQDVQASKLAAIRDRLEKVKPNSGVTEVEAPNM